MDIKATFISQYRAALEMLKQAIEQCPESLWVDASYSNPFWQVTFHVLFYTHFYLQSSEEAFVPWEKHKDAHVSLGSPEEPEQSAEAAQPYSKEELLAYLALCWQQVEKQMIDLDLTARSGFYWLPFDKLELQIYNIRHIQQHSGELCERLGATGNIEIGWVGMITD